MGRVLAGLCQQGRKAEEIYLLHSVDRVLWSKASTTGSNDDFGRWESRATMDYVLLLT